MRRGLVLRLAILLPAAAMVGAPAAAAALSPAFVVFADTGVGVTVEITPRAGNSPTTSPTQAPIPGDSPTTVPSQSPTTGNSPHGLGDSGSAMAGPALAAVLAVGAGAALVAKTRARRDPRTTG